MTAHHWDDRLLTTDHPASSIPTVFGRLVDLAARQPGDYDLYLQVLVNLDDDQTAGRSRMDIGGRDTPPSPPFAFLLL